MGGPGGPGGGGVVGNGWSVGWTGGGRCGRERFVGGWTGGGRCGRERFVGGWTGGRRSAPCRSRWGGCRRDRRSRGCGRCRWRCGGRNRRGGFGRILVGRVLVGHLSLLVTGELHRSGRTVAAAAAERRGPTRRGRPVRQSVEVAAGDPVPHGATGHRVGGPEARHHRRLDASGVDAVVGPVAGEVEVVVAGCRRMPAGAGRCRAATARRGRTGRRWPASTARRVEPVPSGRPGRTAGPNEGSRRRRPAGEEVGEVVGG